VAKSESKTANLRRTPLYELLVEAKARFTAFAGWEMPIQYNGFKQEHQAVRTSVGMFDISHMGKFMLQGKNLLPSLQFLVPSDLERLQPGESQYTVLLNEQAGIIDDLIFSYQGQDNQGVQHGVMIVNAVTKTKDLHWLLTHLSKTEIELLDRSEDLVLIALQGCQAINYLNPLVESDLTSLKAFGHLKTKLGGETAFVARTGYTGEDGFEIMVSPEVGKKLWRSLLEKGITPCGLGARDTLRLEAGMCLYGQDLDETTTPLEAGLGWLVHLDSKGDFTGRPVLEQQKTEGVKRRLVGLEMAGRHIARHGYPVVWDGLVVGEVTSGTWSPTLNKAIALAYIPKSLSKISQKLEIAIRGKNYPASVVKKPFYRSPGTPVRKSKSK
jgi:aminomethyltransferase